MPITSPNANRFSKFFHWRIRWLIFNKVCYFFPWLFECYMAVCCTLSSSVAILWTEIFRRVKTDVQTSLNFDECYLGLRLGPPGGVAIYVLHMQLWLSCSICSLAETTPSSCSALQFSFVTCYFVLLPTAVWSIAMSMSGCLSVHLHIFETTRLNVTKFYACRLWPWLCPTCFGSIVMLCTSGFVDDFMFSRNGPYVYSASFILLNVTAKAITSILTKYCWTINTKYSSWIAHRGEVYYLWWPSLQTGGGCLFLFLFSCSYGLIRYTMDNNIIEHTDSEQLNH